MIVLPWGKAGGLDAQLARHSQMDPQPCAIRKLKRDLFSTRFRTDQFFPGESPRDRIRIASPEDAVFTMQLHADDPLADTIVPPSAEILNFGKLGHPSKSSTLPIDADNSRSRLYLDDALARDFALLDCPLRPLFPFGGRFFAVLADSSKSFLLGAPFSPVLPHLFATSFGDAFSLGVNIGVETFFGRHGLQVYLGSLQSIDSGL